jgi:hypothetical protein
MTTKKPTGWKQESKRHTEAYYKGKRKKAVMYYVEAPEGVLKTGLSKSQMINWRDNYVETLIAQGEFPDTRAERRSLKSDISVESANNLSKFNTGKWDFK